MADIMKETHQDKMALKFLIVDRLGRVNMHTDSVFPGESADIIGFLFRCAQLKSYCCSCQPYIATHLQIVFRQFKLDARKKI